MGLGPERGSTGGGERRVTWPTPGDGAPERGMVSGHHEQSPNWKILCMILIIWSRREENPTLTQPPATLELYINTIPNLII